MSILIVDGLTGVFPTSDVASNFFISFQDSQIFCSQFSYFVVIDFESTCWPDKRLKNPSPEIIEFPAVLYDAKNRRVPDDPLAVFHSYVMPTEEPILSKFCTELTGINQDKVNEGWFNTFFMLTILNLSVFFLLG